MIGRYLTPRAFRTALEDRLKQSAREQRVGLMRLRRQVAFDRLLARLFGEPDPPWLLKGGYAFDLRLHGGARTTKDIDLSIPMPHRILGHRNHLSDLTMVVRERMQEVAERDLRDGFIVRIGAPMADLDAAPYGGARFPVAALLDNQTFATFHLDVGLGDVVLAQPEWLTGADYLAFADIPPVSVAVLPRDQQFAEKIHAYTLPRGDRLNTRVKDLVDLVLLIQLGLSSRGQVMRAIQATLDRRQTHEIPVILEPPPRHGGASTEFWPASATSRSPPWKRRSYW